MANFTSLSNLALSAQFTVLSEKEWALGSKRAIGRRQVVQTPPLQNISGNKIRYGGFLSLPYLLAAIHFYLQVKQILGFPDMWQLRLCKPFPPFYVFGNSTNKLDSPTPPDRPITVLFWFISWKCVRDLSFDLALGKIFYDAVQRSVSECEGSFTFPRWLTAVRELWLLGE